MLLNISQSLLAPGNKVEEGKRKLGLLDWFNSDEENEDSKKGSTSEASTQKIMELIKMADSFKSDPHFKVSLNIQYKNLDPSQLADL